MRGKLVLSGVVALLLVAVMAIGVIGSGAYFSDTETSNGNSFTAGTLDLAVDGHNGVNFVKFTVHNYPPQSGPERYVFELKNLGTLPGFIDLHNIAVTSHENDILEPEDEAGDTTADEGELEDVMGLTLFLDQNGNGWYNDEDRDFPDYGGKWYDGRVAGIASHYDKSVPIAAGGTKYITVQIGWWSTPDDNKAMGDSFDLDITFELAQKAAQ